MKDEFKFKNFIWIKEMSELETTEGTCVTYQYPQNFKKLCIHEARYRKEEGEFGIQFDKRNYSYEDLEDLPFFLPLSVTISFSNEEDEEIDFEKWEDVSDYFQNTPLEQVNASQFRSNSWVYYFNRDLTDLEIKSLLLKTDRS